MFPHLVSTKYRPLRCVQTHPSHRREDSGPGSYFTALDTPSPTQ